MKLGFSVDDLLPKARGGGSLKMGLAALGEAEWLQSAPDLALRGRIFDTYPQSVALTPEAEEPAQELAELLGISGGLEACARNYWEDMCLLTRRPDEEIYRLIGAAIAFPSDWNPAHKIGLPLSALHQPIHGYEEQLATGVDHFMGALKPGKIFGRCNWFISPTPSLRWIAAGSQQDAFAQVTADNAGQDLFVRCERQTLRRLPQTDAILFTIGIYVEPLGALSPANIAGIATSIATIPAEEAARRGTPFYADALMAFAASKAGANIAK